MTFPHLIIFDLDNTLYREPPEMQTACEEAMARAVSDMVGDLSFEEALKISKESNHQTGSVRTFFAENYDLERRILHEKYHDEVDHLILPKCARTKEAFAKIDCDLITLGLLTHGSRGWTRRVLEHLELTAFFHPALIVPAEDVDFLGKHESDIPFLHLMKKVGVLRGEDIRSPQVIMVEDLEKNLVAPHRMGMETVLIHHGKPLSDLPHIHIQAENVSEFLQNFIA